ncbi:carbohydrate-binding family V/XII [Achromobacter anxifer]|uniref:carbohydrate-binding family V/XII n=1 Tax=Achromobacter anxifer TaxID=1287737 RepID=UPI0021579ECE|nr:carbohydrate-binding family V/XII [Achromobacter anxifer]
MYSLTRMWRVHAFPTLSCALAGPPGRRARLALAVAGACLALAAAAQPQPQVPSQVPSQTPAAAPAQSESQAQASQADAVRSLQWPRSFEAPDGTKVELYQPQIDTWTADRITGRMAVAVGAAKGSPTYGVADFSARAEVNKPAGLVHLSDIRVERVQVPTAPQEAAKLRSLLQARLPAKVVVTRLDALQLSYTLSQNNPAAKAVPVDNAPPRIVYRTVPSVLVLIDGEPALAEVADAAGWRRVVNTRALMLVNSAGRYFLQAAGHWYEAGGAVGPWTDLSQPPAALLSAADAARRKAAPDPLMPHGGQPPQRAPAIVVATAPAELLITVGQPELRPVPGTSLLSVANADHALFMNPGDNRYYLLASGRWFRGASLDGPWSFVPGKQLPRDFARISPQDPQSGVLASVPGTPQAKEALIASTIPQTATVSRSDAKLQVDYAGGSPTLRPIQGTALYYAANSQVPVIQAEGRYYALSRAVWFVADSPLGPWRVADHVPATIYAIPASSPLHYVTYVQVYGSTPQSVVFGYTPGYMGVVVSPDGTVVYGTGYAYPPVIVQDTWVGYPPSYGYDAAFDMAAGFAFGFVAGETWGGAAPYWGPYWGAPYWGGVNVNQVDVYGAWGGSGVVTHAAGWNGWTGTEWQGTHAEGYNPQTGAAFEGTRGAAYNEYTGNAAAGRRDAYTNPTTGASGAGRAGVVANDDGQWAAGRQDVRTNSNTGRSTISSATATGTAGQGVDNVDRRGATYNRNTDSGMAWNNGNVYADRNGNVYEHTDNGWQKHTSSGWQPVQPAAQAGGNYLNGQRQARDFSGDRMGGAEGGWQGRGTGGMEGGGWQGRSMGSMGGARGGWGGGFHGGGFRR